eukprot:192071-Pelagomonas_calceolata.AAC.1
MRRFEVLPLRIREACLPFGSRLTLEHWVERAMSVRTQMVFKPDAEKKRKTTQAVKILPTSIKEKEVPRAEAPCIPFTKRNKKE